MLKNKKQDWQFAVVVSCFNDFVTRRLLDGCLDEFVKQGIAQKRIKVVWVPGALEIPLVAQKFAQRRDIDAVIALGAVIRGETIHFELVAQGAAQGVLHVGLKTGKPVIFGVITTENVKQAYARSQRKGDNKGRDAVKAALDMLRLLDTL
jgi:6,7-dimethyl-8-ribityllumazine synthase